MQISRRCVQEGCRRLLLGGDSDAVKTGSVATVQALSGTGSLRIGFEFIRWGLLWDVVW
jgi:aspartate/tyrosine/aromatic aminotransferase